MRDIAAAAKLPLATTVYHFARKEQLYAAVLSDIAAELERELDEAILARITVPLDAREIESGAALDAFVLALVRWMRTQPGRVKLLLRELLDNPARVARASQLPLAPFLERAASLVAVQRGTSVPWGPAAPRKANAAQAARFDVGGMPEVAVLHLVGALSYFVAAWPTVERMLGPARAKQLDAIYERDAIDFARRALGIEPRPHDPKRGAQHAHA
jgi:AcrR family transcriptional regulator